MSGNVHPFPSQLLLLPLAFSDPTQTVSSCPERSRTGFAHPANPTVEEPALPPQPFEPFNRNPQRLPTRNVTSARPHASSNCFFTHPASTSLFCATRLCQSPNKDRPLRGFNSRSRRNTPSASTR